MTSDFTNRVLTRRRQIQPGQLITCRIDQDDGSLVLRPHVTRRGHSGPAFCLVGHVDKFEDYPHMVESERMGFSFQIWNNESRLYDNMARDVTMTFRRSAIPAFAMHH